MGAVIGILEVIRFRHPASLLRRTEALQATLVAVAFWTLAVIALTNLRYVYLGRMPQVEVVIARATMVCCVLLLGLVGARRLLAWRKSGPLVSLRGALGGTPGMLLFATVASYLAIGAAVLGVEAISQPEMAGDLKYRVLQFGVLVAVAVGGRAALERTGTDRLLQGVLVVLISSCAIILASPVLHDLDILSPYRIPFRLTGAFVNPNDASLTTCMTVALAVALLTNGGPRTLGWLGLAAGVAASLATASRTALVVLGAMAVVFLLINVRSKPRPLALALVATGLIGIAGFIGVGGFSGSFSEWSRLRFASGVAYEGNLFCDPSPTDNPGADCAVLLATRDILAGDIVLNWSSAMPVNYWQGVTVAGPEGRVTRLNLARLGLNGRIPAELGRLDRLVSLSLHRNRLTGRIPPELGNLARLERLDLSHNALTGGIPLDLGRLDRLISLYLYQNRLTGRIPPELGNLARLEHLDLSRNALTGGIPLNLGRLDHLVLLYLQQNRLTGPVPPELGNLARLEYLELSHNALIGDIPVDLGRLDRLISLSLQRNRLTGLVPLELGNLARLEYLELSHNALIGGIPPELGKLTDLKTLRLAGNALAGPIPPALAGIKRLSLAVAGNDFHGCMSRELDRLHSHDIDDRLICDTLAIDRLLLWRLGFEKAMESLVFGHGLGALAHMDEAPIGNDGRPLGAHNLYLTLLGEAGIVPLLLRAQWGAPKSLARDATVAWVIVIALYSMNFQHLLVISAFMFLAGLSVATGATPIDGDCHVVEA